jgi:hypothetical protein
VRRGAACSGESAGRPTCHPFRSSHPDTAKGNCGERWKEVLL